jgi:hypothetical protein
LVIRASTFCWLRESVTAILEANFKSGDCGVRVIGKEDINLRREPGAVATRIVPVIGLKEGARGFIGRQRRVGPKEVFVAAGREQGEHSRPVGQQQKPAAVRMHVLIERFTGTAQNADQIVFQDSLPLGEFRVAHQLDAQLVD